MSPYNSLFLDNILTNFGHQRSEVTLQSKWVYLHTSAASASPAVNSGMFLLSFSPLISSTFVDFLLAVPVFKLFSTCLLSAFSLLCFVSFSLGSMQSHFSYLFIIICHWVTSLIPHSFLCSGLQAPQGWGTLQIPLLLFTGSLLF